jgi:hypothetical protein|tara:strand:- start:284 stop:475 length:192 start_codon:yes stop_codon:yes gene_type:complete
MVKLNMEVKRENNNLSKNSSTKVDLNSLMVRVKEEEKKSKRTNIAISAAALSAAAVFGIILTL